MDLITPSPLTEIKKLSFERKKIRLFIKREDLIHKVVSGNKWRKLKYNIEEVKKNKFSRLLTFGGAFSNHIVATAFAAREENLESIGVIRGEKESKENPTLREATSYGMKLHFVSREEYRTKDSNEFIEKLKQQFGNFYLIPEGGRNEAGAKGMESLGKELKEFDLIVLPVGTGTTLAGIIRGKDHQQEALGMAILKGEGYLEEKVSRFLNKNIHSNWKIIHDFHFGGYAKFSNELIAFINDFKRSTDIQLDPVYTGKMMFGLYRLIDEGVIPGQINIVAIHTGGLQGIRGFNDRFGNIIDLT